MLTGLGFGAAIVAGAYILSRSFVMGLVMAGLMMPFVIREAAANYVRKRQEKVEKQFLAGMQAVLSAISAGGSMEQAFQGLYEDYVRGGGADIGIIAEDINLINRNTLMNYSFYDELLLFAVKTESPDIISCAEAMASVGQKGGDMAFVIRNALANLRIKLETDAEIRQTLSLPKYNQKIITVMPFALVLLVRALSAEYAEILYTTRAGTAVVWGVAAVIFAAWILGRKLCAIEV
ncbi:MAG: type II secretion system F family protein [Clostridia bacterium]|nr:type II secretion system F family protein [Clostridia bacterium]